MKEFSLQIVTPDKTVMDGKAISLLIRTATGDVEILAGHTDLLAALGTGRARIRTADGMDTFASVSGGFLSVSDGVVRIAATTFEMASELDLKRAEAAKEKAEQAIKEAKSSAEIDLAKAKLARALTRISVKNMK
ncbi:MAG: ATP synthase F1 subunit epsilon [Clostridia bacterium]|nr:ATP synthase F1 subunit epsilon [Clostridia bacterium]